LIFATYPNTPTANLVVNPAIGGTLPVELSGSRKLLSELPEEL